MSARVTGFECVGGVQVCGSGRELVTVHSWPHVAQVNAKFAHTPTAFVVKALTGSPGIPNVAGWC